ncbi:unnamed protein product [Lymnaea stagnalis]|uniref:DUF7789 domain-containing protein n=1 Tax=Lymnaea stagnalis TaxID=6523 RepID=A0AAV2HB68_LYMST
MITMEGTVDTAPTLTFSDMGLPPVTKQPVNTPFGKIQSCKDLTKLEVTFLFLMLISIITATGFTINRLSTVEKGHPDITFGILLLVNAVFSVWFLLEGIFRERPSEILILTIAIDTVMVYLICNFAMGTQNEIKLARLVIACISAPVLTVIGLGFIARKYFLSKHLIFRTVGASSDLQATYRNLLYFEDGLKLDFQLGISLVVLVMDGKEIETHEIIILILGVLVKLTWFILGHTMFWRELKVGAYIFWALSPIEIGYIIFKIYDVTLYFSDAKGLATATIVCIIGAIIARVLVIIGSAFVYKGFGKGLKEKSQVLLPGEQKLKKETNESTIEASNVNSSA